MEKKEITVEMVRDFLDQASRKYGMLDSKKALENTNGDFQKAERILYEREILSAKYNPTTISIHLLNENNQKRNKAADIRRCNLLWFKDVDTFTPDDLALLKLAFERGYIPLGDLYGDHNPEWVKWKESLFAKMNETL